MSTLANNIKKYRKEKGLTQGQLAEMIGKSKNVISNWENGLNKPDADTIENLMWALGVTADELLGWNNPEQSKADADILSKKILTNSKIKSILPMILNLSDDDLELLKNFIERLNK